MKNTITLLLLLTSISFVTAQSSIGLHFGAGGYHTLEDNNGFKSEKNYSLSVGLDYQVKLKKGFSFYASIGALKISDKLIVKDSLPVTGASVNFIFVDFQLDRLAMFFPTQIGIKYSKGYDKLRFFVQPYIETDILVFNRTYYQSDGRVSEVVSSSSFIESKPYFYTVAFGFGLGIERDLGKKISIYLMPDIKLLFTDIYISTERKSIISAVKLGLLYKI